MIYYMTGLYTEAAPFIKAHRMKKQMDIKIFQVFKGKNELLIISGTEAADASVSACHLFSLYPPKAGDIFLCIRFSTDLNRGVEICHKLRDVYSGKDFYPDLLARHPFGEGCSNDPYLAFAYQGAVRFLPSHGIHIMKVASADFCAEVEAWANKWQELALSPRREIPEDIKGKLEILCENLKLGYSMKVEFKKLLESYAVRNGSYTVMDRFKDVRAETKREGKEIYEEIARELRQ